ncbi:MAG: hypothetical protein U5L09_22540 [Bacteroidales bacterium]|nr:hypothetical protein [Bacteroidales bacterium]
MKKEEREKTEALLRLINDYTNKVTDPQGVPEKIVKDILLGHLRDFYEHIDAMDLTISWDEKEAAAVHPPEEAATAPEPDKEEAPEQEETSNALEEMKKSLEKLKKQFDTIGAPGKNASAEKQEHRPEPPASRPQKEEEAPPQEDPAPRPENKHQKPQPAQKENPGRQTPNKASKTGIGEKFDDNKSSLNDRLSGKNGDDSIGERMKHHHISNLKTAIDINHKFLFISELFEGDREEYNLVIDKLNEAPDMEKAQEILSEYHDKHHWDTKSTTLQLFYDVLKRKY